MKSNKKQLFRDGSEINFSPHFPPNVWVVRLFALIFVLFSIDISPDYVTNGVPHKTEDWAKNWIASNGLYDSVKGGMDVNQAFYADNKLVSNGNEIDFKRKISSSNKTTQKPNETNASNQVVSYSKSKQSTLESAHKSNTDASFANQETKSQSMDDYTFVAVSTPLVTDEVTNSYDSQEGQNYHENQGTSGSYVNQESQENKVAKGSPDNHGNQEEIAPTPIDYQAIIKENYKLASANDVLIQEESNQARKWVATGNIGPQLMNGTIAQPSGNSYASSVDMVNMTSDGVGTGQNQMNQAFSAVLNLGMTIGSNLELLSGVNYSQFDGSQLAYYDSEVEKMQTIITSRPTKNADGTSSIITNEEEIKYMNYFSDTIAANYRVSNFEIPLVLKYNFGKQKLSYFLSSGVSASVGGSYSSFYHSNEFGTGNITESRFGVNSINLLLGVGMQYKATNHISIQLTPGYKYGIPVSSSSVVQTPISSLGIFTGLSYYFK